MELIVETDIGRDADDFFALCYLAAAGVSIRAITITPGDGDQVAVAKFLVDYLGLNCEVGVPGTRGKKSVTPFHHEVLQKYGYPLTAEPDGEVGFRVIERAVCEYRKPVELFCIGPVTNVKEVLRRTRGRKEPSYFSHATMQGGFCSYDLYMPTEPLDKFKGMTTCPTFNLNGDKRGGEHFINDERFKRRFVGKNVCHSIVWDKARLHAMRNAQQVSPNPNSKAINLFMDAAEIYFRKHPEKKFHDPTAAVCMLHPEVGTYVKGKTYNEKGGWGTRLDPNGDDICVDVDREKLWQYIYSGT